MDYLLIICLSVVMFFGNLYYKATVVYTDVIIKSGRYIDEQGRYVGDWANVKRTYKNGKVEILKINL